MVGFIVDFHSEPYLGPAGTTLEFRPVQEESSLLCLPREILEIIVHFLDGTSAASLASTCAMLFNIVNSVAQWEKHVLQGNLTVPDLMELGLKFGTPLWRIPSLCLSNKRIRDLGIPWKQIFYCHHLWRSIRKWNFCLPFKGSVTMDKITSVSIAGQAIVFGTLKGGIGLWNPDKSTSIHGLLRIFAEVDEILVQLSAGCEKDLNYNVIIHGIDTSLTIYNMSGCAKVDGVSPRRDLRKISSHGDSLFEWDPDKGTTAVTVADTESVERCSEIKNVCVPSMLSPLVAVHIFEKLIISQNWGPMLMKYDEQTSRYTVEQPLMKCNKVWISKGYIWPGQISFSITTHRTTIISIGANCSIIKWPHLFKCISALLFSNVLIVGTDIGRVLFYPLNDSSDLLKLDPKSYVKELSIGTREPIIYVGVRAQNRIHELPDVIAATRSELFCFRAANIS